MSTEKKEAEKPEAEVSGMDSRSMLREAGAKRRVIQYNERVRMEVIKKTKYYREGQIIEPHTVLAEQLEKEKIAKRID